MEYSRYFGVLNKEQKLRFLNSDQISRLMNIIFIEGTLHGLKQLENFNKKIFSYEVELSKLTGNLKPAALYKEMLQYSGCNSADY